MTLGRSRQSAEENQNRGGVGGTDASSCLVLILSVHRDPSCSFSWLGNQSMCLSHPWSLLGCVASAPSSHMQRGSPWWPRLVSPSTSPPRSPLPALVCKCTTVCTTSQTVSMAGGEGGGYPVPLLSPDVHKQCCVCVCVFARPHVRVHIGQTVLCISLCVSSGCGFAWTMDTALEQVYRYLITCV